MTFPAEPATFSTQRHAMVESQLRGRGIRDERVLEAMLRVPRQQFTPERYREKAYGDHPLPIGEEQTISQPYIVALMLEALALLPTDKVLEVGTGSGYVTALLAELASKVFSVERHAALGVTARELLARMGFENVSVVMGDGSQGLPNSSPFDAIIVSAAAPQVPHALVSQLAEGGRMIIPVGIEDSQQLQLIRMKDGKPQIELRELCRFVPLVSGNGY